MTVPAPTSTACQLRRCTDCDGVALDLIHDQPAPCSCRCHQRGHR